MSIYDDEYFCPNCNATLNYQDGFKQDCGGWRCTECGQMLTDKETYDGERFEGIIRLCDECGALLSKQDGFSDFYSSWRCEECGHINPINEDEIYDSEEEYQHQRRSKTNTFGSFVDLLGRVADALDVDEEDDDYECDEDEYDDEYEEDDYDEDIDTTESDNAYYRRGSLEKDEETQRLKKQNEKLEKENKKIKNDRRIEHVKKYWKAFLITIVIIVAIGYGSYKISEYKKLIAVGVSSDELKGLHFEEVERMMETVGFLSVELYALDDLKIEEKNQEELVEEVVIDGIKNFEETQKFSYEDEVVIRYHTIEEIYVPISSKDANGENYKEILKKFKDVGFVNVKTKPIYDLVTGWIKGDGEVEELSIDGDKDISTYSSFRPDAEVIIEYHTFKIQSNI